MTDDKTAPPFDGVVLRQAEEELERWLSEADQCTSGSGFRAFASLMPDQAIAACAKKMYATSDNATRIQLASLVRFSDEQLHSGIIRNCHAEYAESVLVEGLSSASIVEQWRSALSFGWSTNRVPRSAIRPLWALVNGDARLQVLAAAAFWRAIGTTEFVDSEIQYEESFLLGLLKAGLTHPDLVSAAAAARVLGEMNIGREDACAAMVKALSEPPSAPGHYYVCEALAIVGVGVDAAKAALIAFVNDESRSLGLRQTAAMNLVRVLDADDLDVVVEGLLAETDAAITAGLLAGLRSRPELSSNLHREIREALTSDEVEIRVSALKLVKSIPGLAKELMPQLLDRVGQELHIDAADALADALVACGDDIGSMLTARAKTKNMAAMMTAGIVLQRLGVAGARAVAGDLRTESDVSLRVILLAFFRELHPHIAAIARELGELLVGEAEDEPAVFIAQALCNTGSAAKEALPSLISFLTQREGPAIEWVERAIRNIGPEATALVEAALEEASSVGRKRLEQCLGWISPIDPRARGRFDLVGARRLLLFLRSADYIVRHGSVSYSDIAGALKDDEELEEKVGSVSKSSIARAFESVQLQLASGRPLLAGSRTGKRRLTARARRLRSDIRQFLFENGLVSQLNDP